jgi:chromatin remodeling complex protein RSC6
LELHLLKQKREAEKKKLKEEKKERKKLEKEARRAKRRKQRNKFKVIHGAQLGYSPELKNLVMDILNETDTE